MQKTKIFQKKKSCLNASSNFQLRDISLQNQISSWNLNLSILIDRGWFGEQARGSCLGPPTAAVSCPRWRARRSYKYTQRCLKPSPPPGSTIASTQKCRQVWPKLHGQIKLSPQLEWGKAACSAWWGGHIPATALGCSQRSLWLWGTRSPETISSCACSRQMQNGSRGCRWVSWSDGNDHAETFAPAFVVQHGTRLATVIFCKGPFCI